MNSIYKEKRVIQCITTGYKIPFHDATFSFRSHISNYSNVDRRLEMTFTSSGNFRYIIGSFALGSNRERLVQVFDTKKISKSYDIYDDFNGLIPTGVTGENLIYLPDEQLVNVTKIIASDNNKQGATVISRIQFRKVLPNLTEIDFKSNAIDIYLNSIDNVENLPSLIILRSNLNPGALSAVKNSNIKHLVTTCSLKQLSNSIPASLEVATISNVDNTTTDLTDIYSTGNLKSLSLTVGNAQTGANLNYSGGAIFPTVISYSDTRIVPGVIFEYTGAPINNGTLKGDGLSQFLIDFANQVTTVTIPTAQRRMRFRNMNPNTSYEDLSQPLFTTYASALEHITNTLGITVQFT